MQQTTPSRRARRIILPVTLVALSLAGVMVLAGLPSGSSSSGVPMATPVPESPEVKQAWKEVDQMVNEQKFQAALERVAAIREAAQRDGDDQTWTRSLIEEVQLRTGLHGFETSVRFLREQPWPAAPDCRAILELFYGSSLVTYANAYSWEIRQRERVDTEGEIDLKAWTLDQIVAEAHRAYGRVWQSREEWGESSIGSYARYITQGNYPARIRGTLRDSVTYLWVELLANSSLWRPEQSNELFRLDLPALIEGDPKASRTLALDDPAVHPIAKICALLDDLEAWHRSDDRDEAALEARLERLRRLQASFSRSEDRLLLRQHLESVLEDFDRGYDWWSMGISLLAEMVRTESDPDSLVRAREIALQGLEAHPESTGGQRCRHIVASIEAPNYQLAAMASDGVGKRSLQLSYRNLGTIHFRAYRFNLQQYISKSQDYNILPRHREVMEIVSSTSPDTEWSTELPATPDYRSHLSYVVPPMTRLGAYLVVASVRADFATNQNQLQAATIIVSDLVLLVRPQRSGYEVTVRSGETGKPVSGATVVFYRSDWRRGHQELARVVTAGDGRVELQYDNERGSGFFIYAERGDQIAFHDRGLGRHYDSTPGTYTSALIYTDRSVYRPGHTLHWKAVVYSGGGKSSSFATQPDRKLSISLRDANGEVVEEQQVTTNSFGSVSGELRIPSGRLLGTWQLNASLGGSTVVQVEEYKRPTFEVSISEPETALRLNRPATLGGEVRYYFGLPVVTGSVAWQVTREPVYPYWYYWWWPSPNVQSQMVANGTTSLDADGRFEISFTPEADEREKSSGVTYRYRIAAEVTDEGGETRSASRSFRLGFVAVEARIDTPVQFFRKGETLAFDLSRSDLDGVPRAGKASWRLVTLAQPKHALLPAEEPVPVAPGQEEAYRTPGDKQRPRWFAGYNPDAVLATWQEADEVATGTLQHDQAGRASLELEEIAKPGAYRLVYTTEDDFGATYETSKNLLVSGDKQVPVALPALLLAERSSVPVGETARLLVHSGLADQELVFETFRDGNRTERRVLHTGKDRELIEIPITAEDRGGFGVSLTLLRDHQVLQQSCTIFVPWDDRQLQVAFSTFRDKLRPGSNETFTVTVRSVGDQVVDRATAELLAYMYDRSLDIFAPHSPPSPISLYPNRASIGSLSSTIGQAGMAASWGSELVRLPGYPHLYGDQLKWLDGYGIGGMGVRRMKSMAVGGVMERGMAMPAPAPQMELREEMVMADADAEGHIMAFDPLPEEAEQAPAAAEAEAPQETVELRSDFSETAFWQPHLLLQPDGSAAIEFSVPDSVTEWNIWVHAVTRDLRGGSLHKTTRSVKELMVRPYLPRFLREGDQAVIKVVVNNAGEEELSGTLDLELFDPETDEDLRPLFGLSAEDTMGQSFTVPAGGGSNLGFPLRVPARVGTIAFRIVARAGDYSDGELRSLPVLPGRMHLVQSRFVTLHDADKRSLHFADMARNDDPSMIHDQLVVTIDAQLFYSVLNALPYLVDYPYECTEQTLNRFVSTGILTSMYDDYPAVADMAKKLSARDTRLETWDEPDPNRSMTLEETPWLVEARGGKESPEDLIKVLDPRIARAERDSALAKLKKTQTSIGAFPWWPGGPPSPYMTLYLLSGLSRALEHDVEVPKDMVVRAWSYLHRHYLDELVQLIMRDDCCWEFITYLNFVLSSYPDESWTGGVFTADERKLMLDFSFRYWKKHQPLLKGYLSLTLLRANRRGDAVLVFDSVMDSAKTTQDDGTFWAPEDRAWLWYNDTIESHAFALRVLTELQPDDARRHGLVQWLLINKKLNHWKSTRATAEVIYAMVHYLEAEGALGIREEMQVTIGPRQQHFVFEPDEYTGKKNQLVIPGEEIDSETMSTVVVEKETKGFAFASATWHFSTEKLPEEARGDLFSVTRSYFRRVRSGREWVLQPLADGTRIEPGDELEVQLSIRARHAAEYVHLRDPRGAGFEPVSTTSRFKWDLGIGWYEEIRDSGTNFFFEWLPAGEYTFKYRLRANMAGSFRVSPATLQSMYAPEFAAYSSGAKLTVEAAE